MRIKALPLCLTAAAVLCLSTPLTVSAADHTVGEIQGLADGIVAYKVSSSGSSGVQDWINGPLAEGAGVASEWYIIGLSQSGSYDFSAYRNALETYLETATVYSATARQKYALALKAAGSSSDYITCTASDSIGQLGIMSWDYGLHLLNNGVSGSHTPEEVVNGILSMQLPDGGWAVIGEYGDVDVTAMTVTALAPHYPYNDAVHQAVDAGLALLSERQLDSGGFMTMGAENPESSAQVITCLSALGIDCQQDSRFNKNGNNPVDGMMKFRLGDGSFTHNEGGSFNDSATVQAYYSLVAYLRMTQGKGSLLLLDKQPDPQPVQQPDPVTEAPADQTAEKPSGASEGTSPAASAAPSGTSASSAAVQHAETAVTAVSTALPETEVSVSFSTLSGECVESTAVTDASTAPSQTASPAAAPVVQSEKKSGSYKPFAVGIAVAAAVILSLILLACGKRSYKNFLAVWLAAAIAAAVILLTDIRSPEDYYTGTVTKENAVGKVSMTIRCDTIADRQDSEYAEHIPEDGVILETTDFEFVEGDSVYTILTDAARTFGIQTDSRGGFTGMVYVAGINYLYEFQFGDLSGWIYHVNGVAPSVGCGEYIVQDGDRIEWLYTLEVGNDLVQEGTQ